MNIYQAFNMADPPYCSDYRPLGNKHFVITTYRDGRFWFDFCYKKDVIFSYEPESNTLSFDYSTLALFYFWNIPDSHIIQKFLDKYVPGVTLETVLDLFYDSLKIE